MCSLAASRSTGVASGVASAQQTAAGYDSGCEPGWWSKGQQNRSKKNRAHRRERYLVEVTKAAEATASQRFSTKGQRKVLNSVLALLYKHLHPADEQQAAILASTAIEQLARLTHA